MIKLNKYIVFIVLIFLLYSASQPLFLSGFFPMHDNTQVARVYVMSKALSSRQFPVRVVDDLGYGFGYALFNFYAPFPYYIGGFLNLIFIDSLIATKAMFIIGIALSGINMFILLNEISIPLIALVLSVLYVYAPYHALDVYVRGAVGEFYAYAFLPLVVLGILKIFKKTYLEKSKNNILNYKLDYTYNKGILIGALGIVGVLLSHNILGLILLYYLGFFILFMILRSMLFKKNIITTILIVFMVGLGMGLSSFFIIPAFIEKSYTRVESLTKSGSDFHKHFVFIDQLWDSSWGFAGSSVGRDDGMSFKIGKIHLLLGFLSMLIIISKRKEIGSFYLKFYFVIFVFFISSVFMMLDWSSFLWNNLPLFSYIQYPWRFLNISLFSLVIFSSCALSFLYSLIGSFKKIIISFIIIIFILLYNLKYFNPQTALPLVSQDYINENTLRYETSKISDEYLPIGIKIPDNINDVAIHGLISKAYFKINSLSENPSNKIYLIEAIKDQEVVTNIASNPGWIVFLDGKVIEKRIIDGKIMIHIPSGLHKIEFKLRSTQVQKYGNAISIFSIFLLLYVSLFQNTKFYDRKKN